ncbi:zinc finger CCHC domain-containing protein 7 [Rhincodon typus]|uniref:zinc finger CCHC domain-containing protein 7 n=1 Tax=Rhincodon typus TaxID=259920 RepID=UPI00202FE992|nr:zinc finger CCHC domain-containing protein 7 [Rhincodon typus]XP_048451279.1 zinc finger CCHC domain-containing protein 7 [Rhincodon typus]
MFAGYEDKEAYEDELYREESSSDTGVDSDLEFQLYSQVHYANNLSRLMMDRKMDSAHPDSASVEDNGKLTQETKNAIVTSGNDVIVISDDPDVIILSDTECDDSVYACKGVKPSDCEVLGRKDQSVEKSEQISAEYLKSSVGRLTEVQKLSQSRDSLSRKVPQIPAVIKGSENSETEDDEDVESWMMLGHDQEEEEDDDDEIQLNVVGCGTLRNKEGGLHKQWSICEKDLKSLFGKHHNRYYTPNKTNLDCRNCGKLGHISKNCPSDKKLPACCLCGVRGHRQRDCLERYCTNCNVPGHRFQNCIERAYWKKHCRRCQMTGHYADACPEIWRQYHLTINQGPIVNGLSQPTAKKSVYCYNCAKRGHYGHECSSKLMHSHTFPTSPFVYYYDTERDIKMREKRIQKRVEDLRDAGFLEATFPTKRLRTDTANKDTCSKKKGKSLKKECVEKEGRVFIRNSWIAKHKAKHYHQSSLCPKTFRKGFEEDFPREFAAKSAETDAPHYKTQQSPLLFMRGNVMQNDRHLGTTKKKWNKNRGRKKHAEGKTTESASKKKKRVKKGRVHVRESVPENALIVKKKKKCKKRSKTKSQESAIQ